MSHRNLSRLLLESENANVISRRSMLQGAAGTLAAASLAGSVFAADGKPAAQSAPHTRSTGTKPKTVYISFLLHGNMCYDRYTKQEIREKFPRIYATGVRAMQKFKDVTAHIDFPGLTLLSLKQYAPWFLDELKPLLERKQVVMVGCEYAASHPLCADEESDLIASRVTMELMRHELKTDCSTFITQEIIFHPQMPYIMNQIGAKRLIVMPLTTAGNWSRPRRVRGIDGSEVFVYPLDGRVVGPGKLEHYYDTHPDGSFVMGGGDFEQLDNLQAYVDEIARLAAKGKIIKWTTVDRYEKEVGVTETCDAPHPFGHANEECEASPSFSRWVGRADDMIWHGHAVRATDAIRTAGFAKAAAAVHKLGPVDVPLKQSWTAAADNTWDTRFEIADEFPETEALCLTTDGVPTLLSRAWHDLLIGMNSDSSGWFPWTPRTQHRNQTLETSRALSMETIQRFARQIAAKVRKPVAANVRGFALAINPAQARTADVSLDTELPLTFVDVDGKPLPTSVSCNEGRWTASGRIALPAYGYKLLGLVPAAEVVTDGWTKGDKIAFAGRTAGLADGRLTLTEGAKKLDVAIAPFRLSDPSKAAPTEMVKPDWAKATTRIRQTAFGPDLEIFTELAWAVWIRLVIGLRDDRTDVTAEVHVDLPRRFGNLGYDPHGLMLEFTGQRGRVYYDVPYATIEHVNPRPSFVAVQRFAAMDSGDASFAVVARGGNQSFQVSPERGTLAANLGASLQGRADTRPQCIIKPDGYAVHKISSVGDPLLGSYEHQFSVVFQRPAEAAITAHELRTTSPVVRVELGAGGDWPAAQSLLSVAPDAMCVTGFRADRNGLSVVANEAAGKPCQTTIQGRTVKTPAFGVATVRIDE